MDDSEIATRLLRYPAGAFDCPDLAYAETPARIGQTEHLLELLRVPVQRRHRGGPGRLAGRAFAGLKRRATE